jgi:eukaryotic-like serine/threonine-protein kinase
MATPPLDEAAIFNVARQIAAPPERSLYVQRACAEDPQLQMRIEAMLRLCDQEPGFLETGAEDPGGAFLLRAACPGAQIGPYKLLRKLGEGGMGSVFLAEQTQPVQRTVAIKLVKPGIDSRRVLARFEAERRALALMDHPNIAKVLDVGAADSRPYFVMEVVEGTPITQYADQHRLTPRERLELFIPICQAVQHAHQKGIIHRDLKPSNVLIAWCDGKAVPKIIDFGVAKAVGAGLAEWAELTEFDSVVGTLEYMSPEQAEPGQADIDTRSDIYSLGALLYELLTGTTPLQPKRLKGAALLELLRIVREEEPPRPSTRLSATDELPSIAANRRLEPTRLRGALRGDLDWIVMKCLEKNRSRRFVTASELARDLERYLHDEPVEARPPSAVYQLRKFARRNRRLLATSAAFLFLLLLGAAACAWQAVRATDAEGLARENERQALAERDAKELARQAAAAQSLHAQTQQNRAEAAEALAKNQLERAVAEKKRADVEAAITTAINAFLQRDLLGQADIANQDASDERNRNITVRELLDRAAREIDSKFKGQEVTEAAIRLTLGQAYGALADYPQAQKHLQRSLDLRQQMLGASHLDTLQAMNGLGVVYLHWDKCDEAESLFKAVLAAFGSKPGANHLDALITMQNLALLHQKLGRYAEAELLFKQALEGLESQLGSDDRKTLIAMGNLAGLYQVRGRFEQAERLCKAVLDLRRAKLGGDHPDTLLSIEHLAKLKRERGHYEEAEVLYKEVLKLRHAKLGADHASTLTTLHGLVLVYAHRGRFDLAEPLAKQVLEARRARDGNDHVETLNSVSTLGQIYKGMGNYAQAEPLLKQVLEGKRALLSAEHQSTLASMNHLAALYLVCRRYDEAEPLLQEARRGCDAKLGADHPLTLLCTYNLAVLWMGCGRCKEAEQLYNQVYEVRLAILGADHPDTISSLNSLALVHNALGEYDLAEPIFKEVLRARRAQLGDKHPDTIRSMNNLAVLWGLRGRYVEAEILLGEAATLAKKAHGLGHPQTQHTIYNQADLYSKQGKPDLAEAQLRELAVFHRDKFGKDSTVYAGQLVRLTLNLLEQKKYRDAELCARYSLAILAKKEPGIWTTFRAQSLVGAALLGQKKYADAEPLLLQSCEGMKECAAKIPADARIQLIQALERPGQLYEAWGMPEKAAEWQKKLAAEKTKQK